MMIHKNTPVFLALTALLVSGCTTMIPFPVSTVVPAAEAEAKISQDENGNSVIDLRVRHLAPAQNLNPPKATYVVWVETADHKVVNLGQLRVSENRSGRFRGTTPLPEFRVLLTAEDAPNAILPTGHVVLRTDLTAGSGEIERPWWSPF